MNLICLVKKHHFRRWRYHHGHGGKLYFWVRCTRCHKSMIVSRKDFFIKFKS